MANVKAIVRQTSVGVNQPTYKLFVRPAATISTGGGGGGGPVDWADVQNKPSTFPPSAHNQAIGTIIGLQAELDRIETIAQLVAIGISTDPPATPAAGERYVAGLGATGAWAGRDGDIATWTGSAWAFLTPGLWWRLAIEAGDYVYVGGGVWEPVPANIVDGQVTNDMLSPMQTGFIKGRLSLFNGPVEDLNAAQVRTWLNVANGATANATDAALRDRTTHTGEQPISTVTGLQAALDGKQPSLGFTPENAAQKGVAGGYAALDGTGRVPASQLPSFVDDVLEFADLAAFPVTGETGKIYADLAEGRIYRWSGSAYVEISASPGSTDAVTEGTGNLYFTEARVRGTALTGYAAAGARVALAATDTVLGAFNKVGRWLSDLAAIAFSGSASDLIAGTLPAARFNDTAHGNRGGGSLHPAATTSVAGFMSSADKTKLDGVATGATANATDAALRDRATHTGTQLAATISDFGGAARAALSDYDTTVTAGATTTLTAASKDVQVFTGTSSQTVVLPAVSTLTLGRTFLIRNASTSTITVQSSGGTVIGSTIGSNMDAIYTCIALTGTDDTPWLSRIDGARSRTGSGAAVFAASPTFSGTPILGASAAGGASLRMPHGAAPTSPVDGDIWTTTAGIFVRVNGVTIGPLSAGGGGVTDGDKGDITVSGSGANWVIDAGAVTLPKMADLTTSTIIGRASAGSGAPEALTAAQVRTILNVANGATANAADAFLLSRANHTGTQAASTISDFNEAVDDEVANLLVAGPNITLTYNDAANTLTIAATGGGGGSGDVVGPASATDNALARFEATTGKLIQNSGVTLDDTGVMTFPVAPAPAAPSADAISIYARSVAGQHRPTFLSRASQGVTEKTLEQSPVEGNYMLFLPAGGTTVTTLGAVTLANGTVTAANVTSGTRRQRLKRVEYLVTTAAATAVAGWSHNASQFTVGGTNSWEGGFYFEMFGGVATGAATATHRFFMGMRDAGAPTDVEPSTFLRCIGIGYDAADANLQFMHNDATGVATKIDLGASFAVPTTDRSKVFRLRMFSPPGSTQSVTYEVTDIDTGAVATGTVTTNLPGLTDFITPRVQASVGGTSSVIGVVVGPALCRAEV